jgi:hypothetical protein
MDKIYVDDFIQKFVNEQQIGKVAYIKRISHDFKKLYTQYPNLTILNNSGKIEIVVYENCEKYSFVLNNAYPFTQPQIYYNDKPYLELLKLNSLYEKDLVVKYRKKDCLCCDSYYCSNNWSPALNLNIIIDEIKNIVQFKKTMVEILLADKIKEKYLIDDIDINSYLI